MANNKIKHDITEALYLGNTPEVETERKSQPQAITFVNPDSPIEDINVIDIDSYQLNNNDKDVIFIKQYKCETKTNEKSTAVKKPSNVIKIPLRRNPKRKVNQQKNCIVYDDDFSEIIDTPPRRSTRFQSNICDSSAEKQSGKHQLQKLQSFSEKSEIGSDNMSNYRKKVARKKCDWKIKDYKINRGFATLMHHRLHYVLSYIVSLKEYNAILRQSNHESNSNGDRIMEAMQLLADTCKLYCIANNVSDSTLAKYLVILFKQDNVVNFLDTVIRECDEQEDESAA